VHVGFYAIKSGLRAVVHGSERNGGSERVIEIALSHKRWQPFLAIPVDPTASR
jgi:hypothetical protein